MSTPPAAKSPPVAADQKSAPTGEPAIPKTPPPAAAPVLGALEAILEPGVRPSPAEPHLYIAMAQARAQARLAAQMGEVPVGAVVLFDGRILAQAHNRREVDRDPLAHAEILVLRQAAQILDRWRLSGCTLVVTLEPCPMCAGAIVNSRIDHVVFGAWDGRAGAVGSLCNIVEDVRLNHRAQVTAGVEAELCRAQLQQFFAARRQGNKRCGL